MRFYVLGILLVIMGYGFTSIKEFEGNPVLMESISDKYEGNIKKGLAHGIGKASGESDRYEGEFRKGYPHGEGIYVWGNGNVFKGEFYKGKLEGKGELHFKRPNNLPDSIQIGYFKDNKYVGLYREPYKIVSEGGVRNVSFHKKASSLNQLSFEVYSNGAAVSSGKLSIRDKNNTVIENIAGLQTMTNAVFPLERVEVSFTIDKIHYNLIFDLFEAGNWNVVITV